jgi:hypothetical protein
MLIFLATLLATLSSILRSRAALELENLALRHQIGVLQRSARKRPKLILLDRLLWAWLACRRRRRTEPFWPVLDGASDPPRAPLVRMR